MVATIGASLVLGLGLVVSGFSASFENEAARTVGALGASHWAVPSGSSGPFSSFEPIAADDAYASVGRDGVGGVLVSRTILGSATDPIDALLIGVEAGRPGSPATVESGRTLADNREVVVSTRFGFALGDEIMVGGDPFEVVGKVDATLQAGLPLAVIPLADAQRLAANGQPLITALALDEAIDPSGDFRVVESAVVKNDALRPLDDASATISLVTLLLWVVAALIVGSVLYLNTLERTTDVAVFKAIGVPGRKIIAGTFLQAAIVAVAASVMAIVIGVAIAPFFPLRTEIERADVVILPLIALVVSFAGALAGVRRTARISPALAFGGP